MLTVCEMRSQDTTDVRPVVFPFWMAREIALDLSEKERLEALAEVTDLQLLNYGILVEGLERQQDALGLQLVLERKRIGILELELKMERERKPGKGTFVWVLRLIGALGVGYFLGHI